MDPG
jgi:hypothetical protein